MNRKDIRQDRRQASATDLRRKDKENRKLQLELRQEREKYGQMVAKYQRELGDVQAVSMHGVHYIIAHVQSGSPGIYLVVTSSSNTNVVCSAS